MDGTTGQLPLLELGRNEEAVSSFDRVLAINRNMQMPIMTRVLLLPG